MLETYIFYLQYHTTSRFKVSLFLKSLCVVCFYKPNILSNSLPNGNAFEILSFPQQSSKKRKGKLSGSMGNMPGWSIFLLECLPTHISGPERHGTRDVCQRLWPLGPMVHICGPRDSKDSRKRTPEAPEFEASCLIRVRN